MKIKLNNESSAAVSALARAEEAVSARRSTLDDLLLKQTEDFLKAEGLPVKNDEIEFRAKKSKKTVTLKGKIDGYLRENAIDGESFEFIGYSVTSKTGEHVVDIDKVLKPSHKDE